MSDIISKESEYEWSDLLEAILKWKVKTGSCPREKTVQSWGTEKTDVKKDIKLQM